MSKRERTRLHSTLPFISRSITSPQHIIDAIKATAPRSGVGCHEDATATAGGLGVRGHIYIYIYVPTTSVAEKRKREEVNSFRNRRKRGTSTTPMCDKRFKVGTGDVYDWPLEPRGLLSVYAGRDGSMACHQKLIYRAHPFLLIDNVPNHQVELVAMEVKIKTMEENSEEEGSAGSLSDLSQKDLEDAMAKTKDELEAAKAEKAFAKCMELQVGDRACCCRS